MFLGLTEKGLSVTVPRDANVQTRDGWSLDEEMTDLTDFYLRALDELATTSHGREVVLPALLDGAGDEMDLNAHGEFPTPSRTPAWTIRKSMRSQCAWRPSASI